VRLSWLVVGAGRCGLQLARHLQRAGVTLAGVVVSSTRSRARVRRALPGVTAIGDTQPLPAVGGVLVAVPDGAVPSCAAALAARLHQATTVVLHTSGLLTSAALAPLARAHLALGSLHPLMTFPSPAGPLVPLAGVVAGVEGDPGAVRAAMHLARRLGMRPVALDAADKVRYHAAAVIAANLGHVLAAAARSELEAVGLSRRQGRAALEPLVIASLDNALKARGLERLTGPLARGDAATVTAHLDALEPGLAAAYRAVARHAVARLLAERLLSVQEARALDEALTSPGVCGSVTTMRLFGDT
jgi:predicted short-subunit dehydrogenase-like oxidoreductase (DUF2520 family)